MIKNYTIDQDHQQVIPVEDRILALRLEIEEADRRLQLLEQRRQHRVGELKKDKKYEPDKDKTS